ncbi:MAG: hypothetical protein M0D57_10955 [Sphingobacteriales bacterium JAD_PAG50586_3]|nr:MAG: hypothetical protein M0D57_10955 [Sphingobacteriales bacterium JAD_PAG50586_3]
MSSGMFFSKRSFTEISCAIAFPTYSNYTINNNPGYYYRKLALNKFIYSALNYGYKIPLGKRGNGHFATRVGFVVGATSATDTMNYWWGHSSAFSYKNYKKGVALGYNLGVNLGFVLNKRTRLNVDCIYTYAMYFPSYLKTNAQSHQYVGAGQFIDSEGNYIYTYKPFSGPKIPINMLSLNVGLSWNF